MSALASRVEIVSQTMTSRTSRALWNDIFRENGQYHAEKTMPLHFEFGAYQRYRYTLRSTRYTRAKFRKYGHRNPNVLKGDLRRIILATARGGVTATYRGWQMRARGTQKHSMWGQTRNELEQISQREEQEYGDSNMRKYVNRAGTAKYQQRTRRVIRK
jgi:hypothetical protein